MSLSVQPRPTAAVQSPVVDQSQGIPVWTIRLLLLICLFSPYGVFDLGGGALRPDHVTIYTVALFAVLTGRLKSPPPLALCHFAVASAAILGTIANLEVAKAEPLFAFKQLDGLLRAPLVMTLAASVADHRLATRSIVRTIGIATLVMCAMAIVERVMPDSGISELFASLYGGPPHTDIGFNHKQLMLQVGRASAVFVTAPSLAMASVFVVLLVLLADREILGRLRWIMLAAGLLAGFLSNSKSFVLGIPLGILLSFTQVTGLRRLLLVFTIAGIWGVGLFYAPEHIPVNPLAELEESDDQMHTLTSGRFTKQGSILSVSEAVFEDSPFLGYGLGRKQGLGYADSAINRYMLYAGVTGLLLGMIGFAWQFAALYRMRALPWASLGWRWLVLPLAFGFAVPFLQVPRLNDLFSVVLGVLIAATRPYEPRTYRPVV